jgi:hypothetical protein
MRKLFVKSMELIKCPFAREAHSFFVFRLAIILGLSRELVAVLMVVVVAN